jgi:1,4-dihydroxy-6-naphthoate synthase
MKIKIGISPCPNDTYIFDAIYSRKIDCEPFEFEFVFEDVETLNQMASRGECDVIKLSYANYFRVLENYIMLRSGSALGYSVGPLLISKSPISLHEIDNLSIAIPGVNTTANFLLHFAFPKIKHTQEAVFSQIEQMVLDGHTDAGVIIHENRFTYQSKGLLKLMDLGEYWESQIKLPIPLGGIAVRRNFTPEWQFRLNQLVHQSIVFAQQQAEISEFVKCHAQEMDTHVMRSHIDLYVNENTINLNEQGLRAVEKMKEILEPNLNIPLFIHA